MVLPEPISRGSMGSNKLWSYHGDLKSHESKLEVSVFFLLSGCVLPWEGEDGGHHLSADQTHRLPPSQNGPAHQEKKGNCKRNSHKLFKIHHNNIHNHAMTLYVSEWHVYIFFINSVAYTFLCVRVYSGAVGRTWALQLTERWDLRSSQRCQCSTVTWSWHWRKSARVALNWRRPCRRWR